MEEVYAIETWAVNGFGAVSFTDKVYTDKRKATQIAHKIMHDSNRRTMARVKTLKVVN